MFRVAPPLELKKLEAIFRERMHYLDQKEAGVYRSKRVETTKSFPALEWLAAMFFCFGTERIFFSGEASGLLNLFGEGISSALASGRITLLIPEGSAFNLTF